MHNEGHLPLVTICNTDIVVSLTNIELDEVASIFQLVHKVRDDREGVCVASSVFIEVAIVLARVKFAIFLFNKEGGEGVGGIQGVDLSSSKVFCEKVFSCLLLIRREQVDLTNLWHE